MDPGGILLILKESLTQSTPFWYLRKLFLGLTVLISRLIPWAPGTESTTMSLRGYVPSTFKGLVVLTLRVCTAAVVGYTIGSFLSSSLPMDRVSIDLPDVPSVRPTSSPPIERRS